MRRSFVAALAAGIVLLLPAAPAAAHGDRIKLDVAGDGATGVTCRVLYDDGHPVDDKILRLVLVATRDDGRTAGPIQLDPAAEGRGFYTSGAVLTPGRWTVVVTVPAPNAARVEATVVARAQQTAAPPAADRPDPGRGRGRTWWLIGLVMVAAAVTAAALFVAGRRIPARRP